MGTKIKGSFESGLAHWNKTVSGLKEIDWVEQLRKLNDIADLITPDLGIEEITRNIYVNVNHILDAYQFAIGIFDEHEKLLHYKGMIENGERIPDFTVDAFADNRFASWCIIHEQDIFMNDIDKEYNRYLKHKPIPLAGSKPRAALYVPLKLYQKVVGLITVRTIYSNVYQPHHLHILKTVGNFVVRALELAKTEKNSPQEYETGVKEWRWCKEEDLSTSSKKLIAKLTEREREVLVLMISGSSNKELAEKLFVSPATIKTHTLNIYLKLDVANRTAAILKAIERGWVI